MLYNVWGQVRKNDATSKLSDTWFWSPVLPCKLEAAMLCSPSYMGKPCVDGNLRDSPNWNLSWWLLLCTWFMSIDTFTQGFPGGSVVSRLWLQCRRHRFNPWIKKIPWRRKWKPTPVFLPGKSHGQKSLVGYSPWGCKRIIHDLATKQTDLHIIQALSYRIFQLETPDILLCPVWIPDPQNPWA